MTEDQLQALYLCGLILAMGGLFFAGWLLMIAITGINGILTGEGFMKATAELRDEF